MIGKNIHGGTTSWSTESIRQYAEEGGGVPPYEIAVHADNGDVVVWEPSGEVRTVIEARNVVIVRHSDRWRHDLTLSTGLT